MNGEGVSPGMKGISHWIMVLGCPATEVRING